MKAISEEWLRERGFKRDDEHAYWWINDGKPGSIGIGFDVQVQSMDSGWRVVVTDPDRRFVLLRNPTTADLTALLVALKIWPEQPAQPIIKPLEWVAKDTGTPNAAWVARTPFHFYSVIQMGNEWVWRYSVCFDCFPCESLEAGKAAAFAHWCKQLEPVLGVGGQTDREKRLEEAWKSRAMELDKKLCWLRVELRAVNHMGVSHRRVKELLAMIDESEEEFTAFLESVSYGSAREALEAK